MGRFITCVTTTTAAVGETITCCLPITSSSPTISIGDPISIVSNNEISKTLGDPSTCCITGTFTANLTTYGNCCCIVNCAGQYCFCRSSFFCNNNKTYWNVFFRTGPCNFVSIKKAAILSFCDLAGGVSNNAACLIPACTFICNITADVSTGSVCLCSSSYVVDCPCTGDLQTYNSATGYGCHCSLVNPPNTTTAVYWANCCCCCTGAVTGQCYFFPFPQVGRSSYGLYAGYGGGIECAGCCFCDLGTHVNMRGPVSSLATVLKSCTGCSYYVIYPFAPMTCCACNGYAFCKINQSWESAATTVIGDTDKVGYAMWKFSKCTSNNEVCLTPTITCNDQGAWKVGYSTKNGKYMYGEKTQAFLCTAAQGGGNTNYYGCGYLYSLEINDSFVPNPACGAVSGSERLILKDSIPTGYDCFSFTCETEWRFWPHTEDDNGWILATQPVISACRKSISGSTCGCWAEGVTSAYLKVMAVKPSGTGAMANTNIVCVCNTFGDGNAICFKQIDVQAGTCSGNQRYANLPGDFASKTLGCFTIFNHGDIYHGWTSATVFDTPARFDCYAACCYCCNTDMVTRRTCYNGALPQTIVATGFFDETNCYTTFSLINFYKFFIDTNAPCAWCSFLYDNTCTACFYTLGAFGHGCLCFCVDNATCCAYVLGCSGLNDYTKSTECNDGNNRCWVASAGCDMFDMDAKTCRFASVNAMRAIYPHINDMCHFGIGYWSCGTSAYRNACICCVAPVGPCGASNWAGCLQPAHYQNSPLGHDPLTYAWTLLDTDAEYADANPCSTCSIIIHPSDTCQLCDLPICSIYDRVCIPPALAPAQMSNMAWSGASYCATMHRRLLNFADDYTRTATCYCTKVRTVCDTCYGDLTKFISCYNYNCYQSTPVFTYKDGYTVGTSAYLLKENCLTVDKFALALTVNQSNITTFAGLAAEAGSAGESIKYMSYKSTDKIPVCGCASNCSYSAYCPVAQVTSFCGCYQTGSWCSAIPCTAGSLLNVYGIAGGATVPSQDGPFGGKVCVALCMCYTPGESPECALYFENVSPYNSK